MGCRAIEKSRKWDVAQMGCRAVEKSRKWDVAQMESRAVEMSRIWKVAQMGCRAIGMSRRWDIAQKNVAQMMWTHMKSEKTIKKKTSGPATRHFSLFFLFLFLFYDDFLDFQISYLSPAKSVT